MSVSEMKRISLSFANSPASTPMSSSEAAKRQLGEFDVDRVVDPALHGDAGVARFDAGEGTVDVELNPFIIRGEQLAFEFAATVERPRRRHLGLLTDEARAPVAAADGIGVEGGFQLRLRDRLVLDLVQKLLCQGRVLR